ncbi:BglG family transcriptional antiterminator [Trichococcus patagoniensis]|uniref:BglG family transcriptional antiterminator n=1 Tax=Trichococcus patagoniensis TaxID=382641 RepID=A0A2T5IEG3_9LACT|nr:PRD domain-containing protein [Trichococcus patagoniensis]PTQ82218.1 BglG family transcriptional antiterminator [Trichococcus patagoniensis]
MKIEKIINNNLVKSRNDRNQELIVMGKGIGFKKDVGTEIDESLISQVYVSEDNTSSNKLAEILASVPIEIIQLTNEIVGFARASLGKRLSDNIYLTLTDHISFAVERFREGIAIENALLWEIKRFYNHEYLIGKEALTIIEQRIGIKLPEDEAGFIALHFVNATMDSLGIEKAAQLAQTVQSILNIVKYHFNIDLNEYSIHYERFVTHLKFFVQRIISGTELKDDEDSFMLALKERYMDEYKCALKIEKFIEQDFGRSLTDNEIIYLTIHIRRVINQ